MLYHFGDNTLDMQRYELRRAGETMALRRKAFQLLAYLLMHHHRVVAKDELIEHLWPQQFIGDAALNSCLREVRQAVGDSGQAQRVIRTLRGSGYRLVVAVEVEEEKADYAAAETVRAVPPDADAVLDQETSRLCLTCRHVNPLAAQFCNACAAPLIVSCSACGQENPPAARFCYRCAAALASITSPGPMAERTAPCEAHPTLTAERRQLTVLFCDLVGSTPLAGQLDPEALSDSLRAYYHTCAEVVRRFDGYVAQYLGDGVLIYFGYPVAHEDDARRAVRSGLDIVDAVQELNIVALRHLPTPLAVRIGIHTGPVVIDAVGKAEQPEPMAMGNTMHVAARLQSVANRNQVVISGDTYRLVQGYFTYEAWGPQTLTGVSTPVDVYRMLEESEAQTRLDVGLARGLTPFVGRDAEIALLRDRWASVKTGHGQVVVVSGEAGIGKSRLVQVVKDDVASEDHIRFECRSSPYYQHTALYPMVDLMQHLLQWRPHDSPETRLEKLEGVLSQVRLPVEETVSLFAALLSLPLPEDRYPPLTLTPERQRQQLLDAMVLLVLEQAERQPVLFILEDLHWADPTTLELLELLIEQAPSMPMLMLTTCRPEFELPWRLRSHLTPLALHRLPRAQVEVMVERVTGGKALPAELIEQLVEKTDGVPLFVEEMTKAVLESQLLHEANGQYTLPGPAAVTIPATLQDSLMARLDTLSTAKAIAQLGATIGRQFSYELIHAVAHLDESTLQHELGRLVEAELLYQRGLLPQATYTFKHALIQDVAYTSLLQRQRREWHRAVGAAIEAIYPDRLAEHHEELAYHFMSAEEWEKALDYSTLAGDRAAHTYANAEAKAHYERAWKAAEQIAPPPDPRVVARLHAKYGAVLMVLAEYEAAVAAYEKALVLMRQAGDTTGEIELLVGLSTVYANAHNLGVEPAVASIDQALNLARQLGDRSLQAVCLASRVRICTRGYGQLVEATPDAEEALHLAREIGEPTLLATSLISLGRTLHWRAEALERSLAYLHEGAELARQARAGFIFGEAAFNLGNAYTGAGAYEEALGWYRQLSDYASNAGDKYWLPRLPNLIGGVHLELFDLDEALRLNLEGDEVAQQFFLWPGPRGHALVKAALVYLQQDEHDQAEMCLRRAESLLEVDIWSRWRWHMPLLYARGEQALMRGQHDSAWTSAAQSLALATQTGSQKHMARAQRLQGEIMVAIGQLGEATQTLRLSIRLAEHINTPREVWLGQAALGQVLMQLGQEREAETHFNRAAQTIEAIASQVETRQLRQSFVHAAPVLAVYNTLHRRPPSQMG